MAFDAEVLILGAGPGGCTLARLLAADGVSVLLVDRAPAATFKVGESLLPEGVALCGRLGVDLRGAGFLPKHGAHFHMTDADEDERFDFRNALRGERAP